MTDRGQTIHDYLIGVLLLVLTIAGVFAFLPGLYTPYEDPVPGSEHAMADRLAENLVEAHTVEGSQRLLRRNPDLADALANDTTFQKLLQASGIHTGKLVNVTVHNQTGVILRTTVSRATSYRTNQRPAATTVRVVRFADSGICDPTCRLVVRVWS